MVILAALPSCTSFFGAGANIGGLTIQSVAPGGAELLGNFTTGYYSVADQNHITLVLLEGPEDKPTQAVTIRMFWLPRSGKTPVDPDATNSSVQYVVFGGADRQTVGVYGGAGYLFPYDTISEPSLDAGVWDSTLRLSDASEGFKDLLGDAKLKGRFTVIRDDVAVKRLLDRLGVLVTQRLGYPRIVMNH